MSLQFVIDAYNLINNPLFKPPKHSQDIQISLIDFIKFNRLSGSRNNTLLIIFDGYAPAGFNPPVEQWIRCKFSGPLEADQLIKEEIERSTNRKNIMVVSDDKEVRIMSRLLHAGILSVEEFILKGKDKDRSRGEEEKEQKISYTEMQKINEELKKKWL